MTTAIPARSPTSVAPLPTWGSGPTLPISVPEPLPFSMPIDTRDRKNAAYPDWFMDLGVCRSR